MTAKAIDRNLFLVKERLGVLKASNFFDVYDPATGEKILECREENLGLLTKLLRWTDFKRMTPFDVGIFDAEDQRVVRVKRGVSIFLSRVEVFDDQDRLIGSFRQKLLSLGGAFEVLDERGRTVCALQGAWTGWEFKFMAGAEELARVTKKWSGLGRELLTSADNYVLQVSEKVAPGDPVRRLILAAVLCIDMVLKE